MPDLSQDSSDFEREKWRVEVGFRSRELELHEREQANRNAEIEIKRAEQMSSTWRSPLIVAILAAAVAAAGNAAVAVVNGHLQRDMEAGKSESDRILEMIKTGDTEKAAGNLEFLVKSGLVTNPALTAKLTDYLKTRMPGSGPSLPSASPRLGFDESTPISPSMQETLQKLLNDYFGYLDKAGFPPVPKRVTVKVDASADGNAYYVNDTIVIDPRMADDPSVPLREYNHHILIADRAQPWRSQYAAIESGLADYFACSYLNNPKLGERAARIFDPKAAYIRLLANSRKFTEFNTLKEPEMPYAGAEIWGGALWEIREKLGRNAADAIIAAAWLGLSNPNETIQASSFVQALVRQARAKGAATSATVESVLRSRDFPMPQ